MNRAVLLVLATTTLAAGALACSGNDSSAPSGASGDTTGAPDAGNAVVKDATTADGTTTTDAAGGSKTDGSKTGSADGAPQDAGAASDGAADAASCALGDQGEPLDLSCTGLYTDWASKTVSPDVLAYDPGLHLWSDGADKNRWIWLPPGTQIDTSDMDEWTFPAGTKIWKEFSFNGQRVETRLLWKSSVAAWYLTTYRWSADQTTAPEFTEGALNVNGQGYEIPPQTACTTCHNGRLDEVLGFEAVTLSSPLATGFTMSPLVSGNWLTNPPAMPLVIPGSATTSAALGYLHINCGTSCHNRGNGNASKTGFYTRLEVSQLVDGGVEATDTWQTGVKISGLYKIPGVATTYRLDPNDVNASSVYYRMDHRDPADAGDGGDASAVQMPPLATHMVDEAGVASIAAWINAGCE
jgi:hypothetical protein